MIGDGGERILPGIRFGSTERVRMMCTERDKKSFGRELSCIIGETHMWRGMWPEESSRKV